MYKILGIVYGDEIKKIKMNLRKQENGFIFIP
jgi:hypothetical protein